MPHIPETFAGHSRIRPRQHAGRQPSRSDALYAPRVGYPGRLSNPEPIVNQPRHSLRVVAPSVGSASSSDQTPRSTPQVPVITKDGRIASTNRLPGSLAPSPHLSVNSAAVFVPPIPSSGPLRQEPILSEIAASITHKTEHGYRLRAKRHLSGQRYNGRQ